MPAVSSRIPHIAYALSQAYAARCVGSRPAAPRFPPLRHSPTSARRQATTHASHPKQRLLPSQSKPNATKRAQQQQQQPAPLPGPPSASSTPDSRTRFKRYLVVSLTFSTIFAFYITFVGTSWSNDIKRHAQERGILLQDTDVSDRWKQLGRNYDDEVEFSEKIIGTNMKGKRKRLMAQAYGKVLEVSAGTGRNFAYYDLTPFDPTRPMARNLISSLTINDQSSIMLGVAEDKFEQSQDNAARPFAGTVDFVVGDAGIRGAIPRPRGGYDTIVETMGLCSMVDPVGCLRTLGKLCRQPGEASDTIKLQPGEDDGKGGRILLLEHGRSSWDIVNRILDSGASMHADHYGCWWNKDIGRIIEQSGLEIEEVRRYHFGTTWEIHLRPSQSDR